MGQFALPLSGVTRTAPRDSRWPTIRKCGLTGAAGCDRALCDQSAHHQQHMGAARHARDAQGASGWTAVIKTGRRFQSAAVDSKGTLRQRKQEASNPPTKIFDPPVAGLSAARRASRAHQRAPLSLPPPPARRVRLSNDAADPLLHGPCSPTKMRSFPLCADAPMHSWARQRLTGNGATVSGPARPPSGSSSEWLTARAAAIIASGSATALQTEFHRMSAGEERPSRYRSHACDRLLMLWAINDGWATMRPEVDEENERRSVKWD